MCRFTRTARYVICIVAQRKNALQDFVDDKIPFERYKHEPSASHSI